MPNSSDDSNVNRFHFEIQHVKGSRNFIPDVLSRLPLTTNAQPAILHDDDVSLHCAVRALSTNPRERLKTPTKRRQVIQYTLTAWPNKKRLLICTPYYAARYGLSIEDDILTRSKHIV